MMHLISKQIAAIILLFVSVSTQYSQTDIYDGPVAGLWALESSPYIVKGNIEIPLDSTLRIEPGVTVKFDGYYSLQVQGRLLAVGTEEDSIIFTVNDTTGFSRSDTAMGGWNGIRFTDTPYSNDTSKISYCRLEYGKAFGSVWHINAGGAICIIQFDKVIINNCRIYNNKALSTSDHMPIGGGLYFYKSDVLIKNNKFVNNSAHSGGAVFFDESNPKFINNLFINNSAAEGGAIAMGGASYSVFINDKILNNTADNQGGGILFAEPSIVKCSNILVSRNKAVWGGGIGIKGGELQADNCTFTKNKAELWGGGVAGDFATLLLDSCLFSNDTSKWGSGGLHMDNAVAEIMNCEFSQNQAAFGGGFHAVYSQMNFEKSNFFENIADAAAGAHIENSDLNMVECVFEDNQAVIDRGGAIDYTADTTIFYKPNKFELNHCSFKRNSAVTLSGGVYLEQIDSDQSIIDISIDNCKFDGNHSDVYASLRIAGNISNFNVSNSTFFNNKSKRYAAGAGFIAASQGKVSNSVFAANYAQFSDTTQTAHGVSLGSGADVDFINCTITDTSEANGIGLSIRRGSKATLTNSIIWGCGNRPVNLVTVAELGCTVDINYCDIENGIDSIYVSDSLSVLNWGGGNINADPKFVDLMNIDLHLQDDSPCIGSGINCLLINEEWHCCPTQDNELNLRPSPEGSNVDMGAFEHSFGIPVSINSGQTENFNIFKIYQNYPNPFNPVTTIKYSIPINSYVSLKVYDILGSEVASIINQNQTKGNYKVEFDGSNLTSGIYLYRLTTEDFVDSRKMMLLK